MTNLKELSLYSGSFKGSKKDGFEPISQERVDHLSGVIRSGQIAFLELRSLQLAIPFENPLREQVNGVVRRSADYALVKFSPIKFLPEDQEPETDVGMLSARISEGQEALSKLSGSTDRFIRACARNLSTKIATYTGSVYTEDDFIDWGYEGAMQAAARYDPAKKVKFLTFAGFRIIGKMRDELRKLSFAGRKIHPRRAIIENAREDYFMVHGFYPTDDDLLKIIGFDWDQFVEVQTAQTIMLSLEGELFNGGSQGDGDTLTLLDTLPDAKAAGLDDYLTDKENIEELRAAIAQLPERDQRILGLYYWDGLTLKEISHVLEVSESRVCQLRERAFIRLRKAMRRGENGQVISEEDERLVFARKFGKVLKARELNARSFSEMDGHRPENIYRLLNGDRPKFETVLGIIGTLGSDQEEARELMKSAGYLPRYLLHLQELQAVEV